MNTPICDFVKEYSDKKTIRLHMPGHKGLSVLGPECLDITEINGADVLYHPDGIIRESEENAASIFGTLRTVYSTEGSSLCIRVMLFLIKLYAERKKAESVGEELSGRKPLILAGRNAHKTFITAAALLDIDVEWMYSDENALISCRISPEKLDLILAGRTVDAVYVTSPDYLGNVLDIEGLAEVCHKHGTLLVVDNAHGAYLKFLTPSQHPMDLGADICCDSAHKTLPVLTGGAYLHISNRKDLAEAHTFFAANAERAFSMFASTSPSYLIMQSLDMANKRMAEGFAALIEAKCQKVDFVKTKLEANGYRFCENEPLKLTVDAKAYGYSGNMLAEILEAAGIVVEFYDPDYVVMMISSASDDSEIDRLCEVMRGIEKHAAMDIRAPHIKAGKKVLSLQTAMMSACETIPADEAQGCVLASADVACPPAIPIAICGEELDADSVECFKYYGIESVSVVR